MQYILSKRKQHIPEISKFRSFPFSKSSKRLTMVMVTVTLDLLCLYLFLILKYVFVKSTAFLNALEWEKALMSLLVIFMHSRDNEHDHLTKKSIENVYSKKIFFTYLFFQKPWNFRKQMHQSTTGNSADFA